MAWCAPSSGDPCIIVCFPTQLSPVAQLIPRAPSGTYPVAQFRAQYGGPWACPSECANCAGTFPPGGEEPPEEPPPEEEPPANDFEVGIGEPPVDFVNPGYLEELPPEEEPPETPIELPVEPYEPVETPIQTFEPPPGHVFLSQVDAGGPLAGITLGQAGLVLQAEADDKETVPIGEKPENDPAGVEIPKTPAEESEVTWIEEDGARADLVPGETRRELLDCDGQLLVVQKLSFTCDVLLWSGKVNSSQNAAQYQCNSDAQRISDSNLGDSVSLGEDQVDDLGDRVSNGTADGQETATHTAYEGVCECAQEAVASKVSGRGTIKDRNDNDIPAPPPLGDAEIVCDYPCVKVWEHWCDDASFEEVNKSRYCTVVAGESRRVGDGEYEHQVEIRTRVKGWIKLVWRATCLEPEDFAGTGIGKAEIESGNLPSDGRPRGHYLPPGTDPLRLPPGIERVPNGCCCKIIKVEARDIEPMIDEGVFWGHRFVVDIDYQYVPLEDNQQAGDCSLKWWETGNNPPPDFIARYGVRPNQWYDFNENVPASLTLRDWHGRTKTCDGITRHATLVDEAGMSWPPDFPDVNDLRVQRNLWIKIEVASGCPPYTTHSLCFFQHLDSRNINTLFGWATMLNDAECSNIDPEGNPNSLPPVPNHNPNDPPNSNSWQ